VALGFELKASCLIKTGTLLLQPHLKSVNILSSEEFCRKLLVARKKPNYVLKRQEKIVRF
jgi:hypothetical protein